MCPYTQPLPLRIGMLDLRRSRDAPLEDPAAVSWVAQFNDSLQQASPQAPWGGACQRAGLGLGCFFGYCAHTLSFIWGRMAE